MNEDGRLVLLADSDGVVCLDLIDALERAGYRVVEACTAAEALSLLEREPPSLAILDPLLCGGGSEFAEELRGRGIPFLVHSALQPDEPIVPALQDVSWLSKPASPADVIHILEELLGRRPVPAPTLRLVESSAPALQPDLGGSPPNPFVRKLDSFTALSEEERALLERISANPRTVAAHADLVHEGDAPEGVFLVMSGFACRHKLRANGARQITAYLLPGDMCDLDVALLDRMDHTITALSPCTVVRITPETIAELMVYPRLARALRMSTLVDEATLREWLVNVGSRSALERIAHLFCELQERLQAVGRAPENGYEFPITQVDLADTTGLSSVHVNRTLQELRRRGLIELREKRLQILNLPGLRAVGEFKANYLHLGDRAAA